jgi:hypothetical protein
MNEQNEQLETRSQTMRLFDQWKTRIGRKKFKGCINLDKMNMDVWRNIVKKHKRHYIKKKSLYEYRAPLPPVDFSNAMLKIFGDDFDFTNWETSPEYRIFLAGKQAELADTIAKLKRAVEKLEKKD